MCEKQSHPLDRHIGGQEDPLKRYLQGPRVILLKSLDQQYEKP